MASSKEEKKLIESIKNVISEDGDGTVLGVFWGGRGSGKSMKVQELGIKIDPNLNVTNITFDANEFNKAIITKENSVIIGDEGSAIAFSRAAMTKENREINAVMDQCRTKRHCVFICIPALLRIDSAILEEANFVAYIWESVTDYQGEKVKTRGNTAYYLAKTEDKDKIIKYLKKKKTGAKHNLKPRSSFSVMGDRVGKQFTPKDYPVGSKAYRLKKNRVLEKYIKAPNTTEMEKKVKLIRQMKENNPHVTDEFMAKTLNLSRQRVNFLKNHAVKPI